MRRIIAILVTDYRQDMRALCSFRMTRLFSFVNALADLRKERNAAAR